MKLSTEQIKEFEKFLSCEEKSVATQEKYLRDVRAFYLYVGGEHITKEIVIAWKKYLVENGYAVRSINSMLATGGWEYHSMETITVTEKPGCFQNPIPMNYYMLIFVREA